MKVFTGCGRIVMEQPMTADSGARPLAKPLVYVVDDEPMLLELAAAVLEPLGYRVRAFRDPEAAMAAFGAEPAPPALVITDYAMHTMNGLELIAACRNLQPRQKILMVSGTVDEQVYDNLTVKPDRFLAKPYQARQLAEAVKVLLPE
jgi:CheY-like chemotaxis protein